jgi:hypothetical protein
MDVVDTTLCGRHEDYAGLQNTEVRRLVGPRWTGSCCRIGIVADPTITNIPPDRLNHRRDIVATGDVLTTIVQTADSQCPFNRRAARRESGNSTEVLRRRQAFPQRMRISVRGIVSKRGGLGR